MSKLLFEEPVDLYNTLLNSEISKEKCFLCQENLINTVSSAEHIIPKWLQYKFNLWDQKLFLPNNTTIRYKDLKIPCCENCNKTILSQIEKKVQSAIESGIDGIRSLDDLTLIQWLTKIHFSLTYKDLFLKQDRTNPKSKTIVDERKIQCWFLKHALLQTLRFRYNFIGEKPWSILIMDIDADYETFNIRDHPNENLINIQIGKIGIIAILFDSQILKNSTEFEYQELQKIQISQKLFDEITTTIFCIEHTRGKSSCIGVTIPNKNTPIITFDNNPSFIRT